MSAFDRAANIAMLWSAIVLVTVWSLEGAAEPSGFGMPRWLIVVIYFGCWVNLVAHICRGRSR